MITTTNLTKVFGEVVGIRDISFAVKPGEVFAVIGPNGSGKTTLLKCLAGLARPNSGVVLINGRKVGDQNKGWKLQISYLPQSVAFPDKLTGREILHFYGRIRQAPEQAIDRVLAQLSLEECADRRVGEYSGGIVQRLGLAVALLPDAPVLLLDEPTAGLDPETTEALRRLLLRARDERKAIVLSSHMLSEIEAVADRAGILVQGRMVAIESMITVRERLRGASLLRLALIDADQRWCAAAYAAGATRADLVDHSLLVSCRAEERVAILHAVQSAGATIESFSTTDPSLEDVYLRYVHESVHGTSTATHDGVSGRAIEPCADRKG